MLVSQYNAVIFKMKSPKCESGEAIIKMKTFCFTSPTTRVIKIHPAIRMFRVEVIKDPTCVVKENRPSGSMESRMERPVPTNI